jgi:hypothetical protein
MNKFLVLFVITAVFLVGIYLLLTQSSKSITKTSPLESPIITNVSPRVDHSAGFAIFTNGTYRIFTAAMYHNLSKDVYIQSDNPNIVYVKKKGITWNDFFETLPFKLTKDCLTTGTKQTFCTNINEKLRFYINGKEDLNALDKQIETGDQLLVTYGNENETQIQKQIEQIPNTK